MSAKDYFQNDFIEYADEQLDRMADRVERSLAPVYDAQAEMGKTLITLSSTALVLSITIVQLLAGKAPTVHWKLLLPASWLMFAATVVLGALRQGRASQATSRRGRRIDSLRANGAR